MILESIYYIAGILSFIIIAVTLIITINHHSQEIRLYVILYIYKPDPYDDIAYICLGNIGKTGAYNINLDKEINYIIHNSNTEKWSIKSHYSFLAPGQKIQWLVGTNTKNPCIKGSINYKNNKNKSFINSYCLDFKIYTGTLYSYSDLHEIAISLKNISKRFVNK